MTSKFNSEHVQSMPIQFGLILISFVCLVACLYKPITQFHPVDNKPHVQPITPEIRAQWHAKDITYVHTGLTITDFLKFDAIKNEYIVNAIISFTFDASKVSLKAIDAFSFTKGDIVKKSEPIITQQPDNRTMALYYIRVQFTSIPDYKRFPLDDHYLYLNVTNTAVDPQKVIFQADADRYTLSENLYAHGWTIVEHQAQAGYVTTHIAPNKTIIQPKMSFSIGLSKQDYRQLLLIILPLLVIFYFGIFAFSIKDIASAITLILSSVSGLIAYSFVIQTLSPAVGYLMLSDYMFLLFLAIIFAIFFITALNATPEHILSRKTIENIKSIAIILIYLSLVSTWYYLTNIKDMC